MKEDNCVSCFTCPVIFHPGIIDFKSGNRYTVKAANAIRKKGGLRRERQTGKDKER